jgi:prepilin-type processing-associated H-X9-DG protein
MVSKTGILILLVVLAASCVIWIAPRFALARYNGGSIGGRPLGEEASSNTSVASTDDAYIEYVTPANNFYTSRHSGGGDIVFVDGHAKWYRPEQIIAQYLPTGGIVSGSCP